MEGAYKVCDPGLSGRSGKGDGVGEKGKNFLTGLILGEVRREALQELV